MMLSPCVSLLSVSQKVIEEMSRHSEHWLRTRQRHARTLLAGIQNPCCQGLLVSPLDDWHAKRMSVACATLILLMLCNCPFSWS
jgi:hypothetical protein